eukprot:scaffold20780_cov53-Attheya_sp.AAC.2
MTPLASSSGKYESASMLELASRLERTVTGRSDTDEQTRHTHQEEATLTYLLLSKKRFTVNSKKF